MSSTILTASRIAVLNSARLVAKEIADETLKQAPWGRDVDGRKAFALGLAHRDAGEIAEAIFDLLNTVHVYGEQWGDSVSKTQLHGEDATAAVAATS